MKLVLTCEHAGNRIPDEFKGLFQDAAEILETHRGFDPGAYDLYCHLKGLASYCKSHKESRLLIELNRSLHHRALFSQFTRYLPRETRVQLIKKYYLPYRHEVEKAITTYIERGEKVLHLSIHSFIPELNGEIRNTDIGLLYDPKRKIEKDWCNALKEQIGKIDNTLKIRMNYPYRGQSDGFTTYLRGRIPEDYCGIEIEINQKFAKKNKMPDNLKSTLYQAIKELFNS